MTAPEVRLAKVTVWRGGRRVLDRVSLALRPGRITVLLGPSESGKTTLVRTVVGLETPEQGTITIGGQDIGTPERLHAARQELAVMLGSPTVFDNALYASNTAFENLDYVLDKRKVPDADRDRRVVSQLEALDLADQATLTPDQLPAYARKRLAIGRTLVLDSPLTILDELDTGMEAGHAPVVLAALREMHERTGCTLLVTTHDVALARGLGGDLAILCDGTVVAQGEARELLRGIDDNEQLEARYRHTSLVPPRTAEDDDAERRWFSFDPTIVFWAVLGIAVITAAIVVIGLVTGTP